MPKLRLLRVKGDVINKIARTIGVNWDCTGQTRSVVTLLLKDLIQSLLKCMGCILCRTFLKINMQLGVGKEWGGEGSCLAKFGDGKGVYFQ